MRIKFVGFWPGFRAGDFFLPFFERVSGTRCISVRKGELNKKVDLQIFSVFTKKRSASYLEPKIPSLWFTGENKRPPLRLFDQTWSFDTDDYEGSNVYFPLWNLSLDWFPQIDKTNSIEYTRAGFMLKPSDTVRPSVEALSENRQGQVCAFIGRPEITRMRAIQALRNEGVQVDVFGAQGALAGSKIDIAVDYHFMLCFENDLYPGYVTEKVLEAWGTGCIPLWRGLDEAKNINPNAIINAAEFSTLKSFAHHVRTLLSQPKTMEDIRKEQIFRFQPNLNNASNSAKKILNIL